MEEQKNAQGVLTPSASYLNGPRGPEYKKDETTGLVKWYVYDGLGSVVAQVDPSGNVTYSAKYDVYGAVRAATGSANTAQGFVGGLGHLSEAATGLIYMRARYYDPNTGRFASEDPQKKGLNWYKYCNDNPVDYIDRTGKDCDLVSTIGSADISETMDGIGTDLGVQLEGQVVDLTGVLNNNASLIVKNVEAEMNISGATDWGYYAKQLAGAPSQFLKAWVRWNAEEAIFDYYIDADAGDLFDHETPSVGNVILPNS